MLPGQTLKKKRADTAVQTHSLCSGKVRGDFARRLHRARTAHRHASHRPCVGGVAVAEGGGQCGGGSGEESAEGALSDFVIGESLCVQPNWVYTTLKKCHISTGTHPATANTNHW